MGRIKTTFIKNLARELIEKETEKFSADYKKNKEIVKQLVDIKSKRMRNIVAGYITALKGKEKRTAVGGWDYRERGSTGREDREGRGSGRMGGRGVGGGRGGRSDRGERRGGRGRR
ncbi:MAG TPA: 30S ribosomal protein S17e [archaeon]|nr:30S ribosomal protein S17e [archaeon]